MRIVQIKDQQNQRRVGIIEEPHIRLLKTSIASAYDLLQLIINQKISLTEKIAESLSEEQLDYDEVYKGNSQWKLLPPIDVPQNQMMCMLSGTGLTHKASAVNRQKMNQAEKNELSDSMIMYLWGEENGKPEQGHIGVQPEWFFKGNGINLKGHMDALQVPCYANDGGEEPEIAGIYLISSEGIPVRLGFTQANEFSDHIMEKKNYLYLAPSKLRNCSIGPELVTDMLFSSIPGKVTISRDQEIVWHQKIRSGEDMMSHSLENLEYHHFKYAQHRIPGQLHVYFLGADAFSFGVNLQLEAGDQMHVNFEGMGRALINTLEVITEREKMINIQKLK